MKRTQTAPAAPKPPPEPLENRIRARTRTLVEQTTILPELDLEEFSYLYTHPYEGFGAQSFKKGWVTLKLPHKGGDEAPWSCERIPQTYEAPSDAECFAGVLHAIVEELKYQQERATREVAEKERSIAELERRLTAERARLQEARTHGETLRAFVESTETFIAELTP